MDARRVTALSAHGVSSKACIRSTPAGRDCSHPGPRHGQIPALANPQSVKNRRRQKSLFPDRSLYPTNAPDDAPHSRFFTKRGLVGGRHTTDSHADNPRPLPQPVFTSRARPSDGSRRPLGEARARPRDREIRRLQQRRNPRTADSARQWRPPDRHHSPHLGRISGRVKVSRPSAERRTPGTLNT